MFALSSNTAPLYGTHGRINLAIRRESRGQQLGIYVLNDYNFTSSVTDMLKILNWQTLENRRIQNSLILLYKTKYRLVAIDHFCLTETRNLNFFVPYSRTKYHMNSFIPRTIRHWNSLPDSLKASTSLFEFTTGLATVSF